MIDVKKAEWESVISALKENEKNPVHEEKVTDIISPNRLDIVIRELALSDLVRGISDGIGLKIYKRWLFLSHGMREATQTEPLTAYFSDYSEKYGFESYCNAFLKLYESIKGQGFDSRKYIPLDGEHNPINGAHRLAVALFLDSNVFVKDYTNIKTGWKWNCRRLSAYFSEMEILLILQKFIQHKKNCYIAIVSHEVETRFFDGCQRALNKLKLISTEIGAVLIKDSNGISKEIPEILSDYMLLNGYMLYFFQCISGIPVTLKKEIEALGIKCLKVK